MSKNTNKGYRKGCIKNRTQVFNPKTNKYIKRDTKTGLFISSSNNKYKNVIEEK
jgi:hypothetical protein